MLNTAVQVGVAPAGTRPRLVQVLPAGEGGVRDHAALLRQHWQRLGVESSWIELSPREPHEPLQLVRRLQAAEGPPTDGVAVLLHFSGYGYDRRGLAFWLADELQAARRALGPRLRWVTLFHELFASGPPWRSAFWLGAWQARLAARLAQLSDAVWTNTQHHARWLSAALRDGGQRVTVRPIYSTVGEPSLPLPQRGREPGLVVFGSQATRQRALHKLRGQGAVLQTVGVQQLIEVGSGKRSAPDSVDLHSQFLGLQSPQALDRLLSEQRFGLIDYPSIHLAKSSVFGAYAAHGNVVLNTAFPGPDADGLVQGLHHLQLRAQSVALSGADADAMALRLWDWYSAHRSPAQARELLNTLCPPRCPQ